MSKILCIETSNQICAVALFENGNLIANKIHPEINAHANVLFALIDNCLLDANINKADLAAIAISKGPGSYTGLRIGVAAAKGFCQALQLPLISISSLESMVLSLQTLKNYDYIIPMLDARRMEVYSAVFDNNCNEISEACPLILEENSFSTYLEKGKVLFIGNGATKWQMRCIHNNAFFNDSIVPLAENMGRLAQRKWQLKQFEDVAYFVPDYLKPVHII